MDALTPATGLAAAIRAKAVSPTEVAELFLARVDELEPRLHAFAHQDPERVRAAAARATEEVAAVDADELAPFHGVPLPIKDLTPVEGWPCTYGSRATSRAPQAASDPLVERFVAGGFVPLGVTTSPEFGTISFTESDAHGITRNP